jgi:hypothetical protein
LGDGVLLVCDEVKSLETLRAYELFDAIYCQQCVERPPWAVIAQLLDDERLPEGSFPLVDDELEIL